MRALFNDESFVGYVKSISYSQVKIHFPGVNNLKRFRVAPNVYPGASVSNFILIEGDERGFLARITDIYIPDSERKELSTKALEENNTNFHPLGIAEILLSFSLSSPSSLQKTVGHYPTIGDKVFSCPYDFLSCVISNFGIPNSRQGNTAQPLLDIGTAVASDLPCKVSANALLQRHCAILGTTGGGKSWTLSRLVGECLYNTTNKIILIDATGEYKCFNHHRVTLGKGFHIDLSRLTNPEMCFLLNESSPNTSAILCNALDSLKAHSVDPNNFKLEKAGRKVYEVQEEISKYKNMISNAKFDIKLLAQQIRNECVVEKQKRNSDDITYEFDSFVLNYCSHMINRVSRFVSNENYAAIFGISDSQSHDIFKSIDSFFSPASQAEKLLVIDLSLVDYDEHARMLAVELVARHILRLARKGKFSNAPIVLCLDEAHEFLNKRIGNDNGTIFDLREVNQIAKEGRKYGLFLCLATQMPRDIPTDILSQMGSFILHRLVNEHDMNVVRKSCLAADASMLSYMPMLGPGEAIICGVAFPVPLMIQFGPPLHKPHSSTPCFSSPPA